MPARERKPGERELFEDAPVPRALASLALPTIAGQLVILAYSLADTFFIGLTASPVKAAGAVIVLPLYNITISLASFAGSGGGTLISRLLGAGDDAEARRVSAFSFWLAAALAVAFAAGVGLFMGPSLRLIGASADVMPFARQYAFWVITIGSLPTVLMIALGHELRAVGRVKEAGFGISLGGVLNIALDPLFMFALFPEGSEIAAVGAATAVSNAAAALYFLAVIRGSRGPSALSLSPAEASPRRDSVRSICAVGAPAAVSVLLFDIDYLVIGRLMSAYSDAAIAAAGIVLRAERLPLNIGIGICLGMVPLAGYCWGAGRTARMREAVSWARNAGLVAAAVSVACYLAFAGPIMRLFIADAETVALGEGFLRARALATPFMFLSFHLVYFFQAVGRGGTAFFLGVVRWAVFNIPMLFILNSLMGMYGIVWSQMTADILTVTVSYAVYARFTRGLEDGGRAGAPTWSPPR